MTIITKSADSLLSLDMKSAQRVPYVSALFAGEALDAVAPCYIDSAGEVKMSLVAQTTVSGYYTDFIGFTAESVVDDGPVTLFGKGARFKYGASLTPGTPLYIGPVAGRLYDNRPFSTDLPVAVVITSEDIVVVR